MYTQLGINIWLNWVSNMIESDVGRQNPNVALEGVLQYLHKVPESTLARMIPETFDTIYTALNDEYMKVGFIC